MYFKGLILALLIGISQSVQSQQTNSPELNKSLELNESLEPSNSLELKNSPEPENSPELYAKQTTNTELIATNARAGQLSLQPNQCVALRKNRDCFATIEMLWSATEKGNYCLVTRSPKRALACWSNAEQGTFVYQFASRNTIEFILIEQNSKQVLSQSKVEVSWLYNSTNKRRRWRLF